MIGLSVTKLLGHTTSVPEKILDILSSAPLCYQQGTRNPEELDLIVQHFCGTAKTQSLSSYSANVTFVKFCNLRLIFSHLLKCIPQREYIKILTE